MPDEAIELHRRQIYRLNRTVLRLDYDVEQFLHSIEINIDDPEALLDSLDLYRGPYLPSIDSHWCIGLRTYLEQHHLRALHRAAAYYEKRYLYADALLLHQRILAVDIREEAAHTGVMRC